MFTLIKSYDHNLRWPSDQTDFFAMPEYPRGIPHQTVAMITNMDFNIYTYRWFYYKVDELLSSLEQLMRELNNTEQPSGHPSAATRDTCLAHVTSKAHSEQL